MGTCFPCNRIQIQSNSAVGMYLLEMHHQYPADSFVALYFDSNIPTISRATTLENVPLDGVRPTKTQNRQCIRAVRSVVSVKNFTRFALQTEPIVDSDLTHRWMPCPKVFFFFFLTSWASKMPKYGTTQLPFEYNYFFTRVFIFFCLFVF